MLTVFKCLQNWKWRNQIETYFHVVKNTVAVSYTHLEFEIVDQTKSGSFVVPCCV